MAYIAAADFRAGTFKPWTVNLTLTEADGTDAYLDLIIAEVAGQLEAELDDDFDPPSPDEDETIYVDGTIGSRLHIPRRVRSLTTVSTRSLSGTITVLASTSYRLRSSLNAAGTAMIGKRDWLDSFSASTWFSDGGIQLIGKFGWAAVPGGIKRLVALRVYDMVKATSDPTSVVVQRSTFDQTLTFGPSDEVARIVSIYSRKMPATV